METSCSNQLTNLEKKKGGTITCVTGRWANRGVEGGQDELGRWSYHILQGREKGGVGCTIYHQQQLDIEEKEYEAEKDVDVRKRFRDDLKEFIRKQHSQGHIVILLADFNDDMNKSGNATNTFLRESGLKNVMAIRHGECNMPHTYDRGKKCLDAIAISEHTQVPEQCIRRAGFLPFYSYINSDHRVIYCDIDTNILFGKVQPEVTQISKRNFTTNAVKKCNKYKEDLRKKWDKAKIMQKVRKLKEEMKKIETKSKKEVEEFIKRCKDTEKTARELMKSAASQKLFMHLK